MKKIIILSVVFIWLFILPGHSLAHTLKSSGTVGAVMHVTPDDDPIAGEQSDFFFEFKDTTNSFNPQNCDCTISVQEAGKEIAKEPLFTDNTIPSLTHASFSYTFPRKNIYTMLITGKPIRAGKFSDFQLAYDLRIDRESEKKDSERQSETVATSWFQHHAVHALPAIVAIVFIFWLIKQNREQKKARR